MVSSNTKTSEDQLTVDDISRLAASKSPETRAEIAGKLTVQYTSDDFSPQQLQLVEQIFRLLAKDAEVLVRKTLSENLKSVNTVPKDIILQLANDVSEVSLPVLEFSEVLTDEDLIEIINTTTEITKQLAISKRDGLSANVSNVLIDTHNQAVISSLLQNQTASIEEGSFERIMLDFPGNQQITELLVAHSAVTIEIADKIMNKISSAIKQNLEGKYQDNISSIDDRIFTKSTEFAAIKLMDSGSADQEMIKLMNSLEKNRHLMDDLHKEDSKTATIIENLDAAGKLTPFTALCIGSLSLFEITMARLAKMPVYNVKKLINDEGKKGFEALYGKVKLPESMLAATKLVFEILKSIYERPDATQLLKNPEHLATYMSEQIMHETEKQDIQNISYFLNILRYQSGHGA